MNAVVLLLGVLSSANALEVGSQQPFRVSTSSQRLPTPPRPLQWGELNVIATTDSHGLLGHQKESFPEPNYSGTWGDYSAFVTHMKRLAEEKDVDLLLVDSGDLHDGTGLTDGYPPGGVDAQDSNEFFKQIPYDVLTIGNHELYTYANTFDMHMNFARHFEGRYLSSNVNITVFDANNQSVSVPVGHRFRKFKTRKGRSVTAFGVLFEFATNDVNTTIQPVHNMIQEQWFLDAIVEEPDVFLLVGHMPIASYPGYVTGWPLVFNVIRKLHPTTPILIFGGHVHIRDCLQLDGRSMSLGSGRYMETVGWMSVDLDEGGTQALNFSRRYLDANVVTYQYHTNTTDSKFSTHEGQKITHGLQELEERFSLTYQYGISPQDYTITRAPYPSNGSLLTLIVEEAVPTVLAMNTSRAGIPSLLILGSGTERYDIFKGPFTRNDQITALPFVDKYLFIPNVPFSAAVKVLPVMNNVSAQGLWSEAESESRNMRIRRLEQDVELGYREWLVDMHRQYTERQAAAVEEELTLGYVTTDACPGVGDDIPHTPLPAYPIPAFIQSRVPDMGGDPSAVIDLIFMDFTETRIVRALNKVQTARVYTPADVQLYSPVQSHEVLGLYAEAAWN